MLRKRWTRPFAAASLLGLSAAVFWAAGCGEQGGGIENATVTVTEPGANVAVAPSGGAAAPTEATPTEAAAAPAETKGAAAAAPAGKAEGFGTLKGRVTLNGAPPALPPLVKAGDMAVKDGAICAAN